MASGIPGAQLRRLLLGTAVAGAAKTVPQNATGTIFTVAGGRVLVTGLVGKVTTVIGGTTPSAKLVATPTVGSANDLCTATAITADEVGTLYSIPGPTGSALGVSGSGSGGVTGQTAPVIVAAGTIGVNISAADATGAIQWTLTYVPLDDGATVTAA
ncbi:hypothetical protein [Streptomyces violascens]|uniref:Uncharacterized protein n=1 Tax=Streptomyces violascens TaxID=67381 RepID=A0ABQ3QXC3_9ACTN|nr:hypothetical protein [Streptomyces violascens]GGU13233.1 hypothetical protein GCM10010289_38630 [Streptomyces violascens]GHI41913.1 hypothetical protein Sviol_63210 [Streptomyces violascens]